MHLGPCVWHAEFHAAMLLHTRHRRFVSGTPRAKILNLNLICELKQRYIKITMCNKRSPARERRKRSPAFFDWSTNAKRHNLAYIKEKMRCSARSRSSASSLRRLSKRTVIDILSRVSYRSKIDRCYKFTTRIALDRRRRASDFCDSEHDGP